LLRKKAAEELKKEQERKAAERRRIIEERCGQPKNLDDANEGKPSTCIIYVQFRFFFFCCCCYFLITSIYYFSNGRSRRIIRHWQTRNSLDSNDVTQCVTARKQTNIILRASVMTSAHGSNMY
jgi:hypothetical protein